MSIIIHLTIECDSVADLGEIMPTLVDLDPIDLAVHMHSAADATPHQTPASGPEASQEVLDEINRIITAHPDQQPPSGAQDRQPWDHSTWSIGERIDWLEGGLWGTDKRLTSLINEVDEHCEHIVDEATKRIAHQATQITDINARLDVLGQFDRAVSVRLDDYLSRFNGLLADFNGTSTQIGQLQAKIDQQADAFEIHEHDAPQPTRDEPVTSYRYIRNGNPINRVSETSCSDNGPIHNWGRTSGFRLEDTCRDCGLVRQEVVAK